MIGPFNRPTGDAPMRLATTTAGIQTLPIAERLPALAVLALGLVILYAVGFSTMPAVHNSTHDTRHSTGFPCH